MSTEVNLNELKINLLTREQYNSIANKNSNEIYMVIDDNEGLSLVAYSGSYNDLKDTPAIPIVTNDLTNELKNKLDGIEEGAQVNEVTKKYVDDLIAELNNRITALEAKTSQN